MASPAPLLHIAACLRIVAKHKHIPKIGIADAREAIQRLAGTKTRMADDERMAEQLEQVTGMPLADLAKLTDKWLPKN